MSYLDERRNQKMFGKPQKPTKVHTIAKKSEKKLKEEAAQRDANTDAGLDKWFEARRKEMTGKCLFCGGKTEVKNDETYRRSIAHLLPKRKNQFPSVATHPDNFIELCFYGNSCHTNLDNNLITWEFLYDSYEWKVMMEKFKKIYPCIAEDEKRNIPEQFLKSIDK